MPTPSVPACTCNFTWEGTGWIDTYELEEDSPDRIDDEGTCPACGGSGEIA